MKSQSNCQIIQPGSTIGLFGSGQLGRMFAMAAKQMGYRVHVFSPDYDSPAGQVADLEVPASYLDLESVSRFAQQVDVITLEFENIPVATIDAASQFATVRPGSRILHITQNRLREKTFLAEAGLPVARFRAIRSLGELESACGEMLPAVLKTTTLGYDGKGQAAIVQLADASSAWEKLNTTEAILEEFVEFDYEVSVIAARNPQGEMAAYAPIRNAHRNHILDVSVCPSGMDRNLIDEATRMAHTVLAELQAVGVFCVEFFVTTDGRLVINEIAPRPHNSGHLTIEAHLTSQFEQQVRAVCGLQLGLTRQTSPAAMVNLLGDCWNHGVPNWSQALTLPGVKLHLYGKSLPEPGRKMGHLTAIGDTPEEAVELALSARRRLQFDGCSKPVTGQV
jgi:5-(carboxyamino)imidazole ribonucleotide synthase